jgi:hypothetical protein
MAPRAPAPMHSIELLALFQVVSEVMVCVGQGRM